MRHISSRLLNLSSSISAALLSVACDSLVSRISDLLRDFIVDYHLTLVLAEEGRKEEDSSGENEQAKKNIGEDQTL